MPDLSHRPTRYALALASTVALAAVGASSFDLRVGPDPRLDATDRHAVMLQEEVVELRRRLADRPPVVPPVASIQPVAAAVPAPPVIAASLVRAPAPRLSCASFPDREAAQEVFDQQPPGYAELDGDGDGLACEQLKSRVVPEPPAPPQEPSLPAGPVLPTAPSKAEILASGAHFGLATGTTEEYDNLEFSLAWDTTMHSYFKGWDTPYDRDRVISLWERGEVPMMTWESRPLHDRETTPQSDYSLTNIIQGRFDEYLTQYARDVKALGLPLVIRFNHEMNGNWYRWSEFEFRFADGSTNPVGSYRAAWRHVHDIFEREGANDLVVWLWAPNRMDGLSRYPPIDAYFPGADYVDWVGMTGYYRQPSGTPTFAATYEDTLDELRRVAPGKPILLAEVGATERGGNKLAWLETFFAGLQRHPDVIGFVWFSHAITDEGVTNDWRINSTRPVMDRFQADLRVSSFGRERGRAPVLVPAAASSGGSPQ